MAKAVSPSLGLARQETGGPTGIGKLIYFVILLMVQKSGKPVDMVNISLFTRFYRISFTNRPTVGGPMVHSSCLGNVAGLLVHPPLKVPIESP